MDFIFFIYCFTPLKKICPNIKSKTKWINIPLRDYPYYSLCDSLYLIRKTKTFGVNNNHITVFDQQNLL